MSGIVWHPRNSNRARVLMFPAHFGLSDWFCVSKDRTTHERAALWKRVIA